MRYQLKKLTKKHSTKAERRFLEILKSNHIPFRTKVKINNREIDFLIGSYAIEIDSHLQDIDKNNMLVRMGYNPIHLNNNEVNSPLIEKWIKKIWQEQVSQPHTQQ